MTRIRKEQITSGVATNGQVLTADGSGNAAWVLPAAGPLTDHDHAGNSGDGGAFDAANLTSGTATDGQVLTADGAGGAAWVALPASSSDAAEVTYTPAALADWTSNVDPGDVDAALDQLAQRVGDLEALPGGSDANAVHVTVAGEIHDLAEKVSPTSDDELLLEDAAAAYGKKRVKIGNLPAGGPGTFDWDQMLLAQVFA